MRVLGWVLVAVVTLASPVLAESVTPKYGDGPVNLSTFQCENAVSSFVHRICYQPDARYLLVLLKSTYYHYCNVDRDTVAEWLAANSKGRFYNTHVKGHFSCKNVSVPQFP